MFICGEELEPPKEDELCQECRAIGEFLCDFPMGPGKTCDRVLCSKHAYQIGEDLHFCKHHYEEYEKWRKSKGYDEALEAIVPFRKSYRMKVDDWSKELLDGD